MGVWGFSLISVIAVSLISLIGILALLLRADVKKITFILMSFAVGGLFGDAFIHLVPEAFEKIDNRLEVALFILAGLLLFFVLEKFLRWRHGHLSEDEPHIQPVVTMNLISDGVHNMIDGMIIGATYMVSIPVGLATTLAVVLHEIPHELGNFGVLVHGGLPVKKAILFNFFSALTAILGTILSLVIGPHIEGYTVSLIPITAGGFIYIAGSDLIPEMHRETKLSNSLLQFALILIGVGIMAVLVLFE